MLDITRQDNGVFSSTGKDWVAEFDSPSHGLWSLAVGKNLRIQSKYAVIENLEEGSALPERPRIHLAEDGAEAQFESAGTIPFGAEPSIRRKFRIMEGFIGLTMDFVIRASFKASRIDAGGYTVSGAIAKIGLLKPPVRSSIPEPVEWVDFNLLEDGAVLFDSNCPPLSVVIESCDGAQAEFSTGEDFWRWISPASASASSRYLLTKKDNKLDASWNLYTYHPAPDQEPPPGRNRRINAYLSWTTKKRSVRKLPECKSIFDMHDFAWPEALLCVNPDGTIGAEPCLSSDGVMNILKRWLRKNLSDLKDKDVLALTNVSPVFCAAAAHQDRAKMKLLSHLDVYPLVDFKRWAEKQLRPYGAVLRIVPAKDSVFAELPVFR